MPRYDEDEDEDLYDPDPSDMDPDDDEDYSYNSESSTEPCPHCGAEVSEYAEQCPACGRYISHEDAPRNRYPRWVVITTILLLVPLIYTLLKWFF